MTDEPRRSCHPAEHHRQFAGLAGCRHSAAECDGADRSRPAPARARRRRVLRKRRPADTRAPRPARPPRPASAKAAKSAKGPKAAKTAKGDKSDDSDDSDDNGKLDKGAATRRPPRRHRDRERGDDRFARCRAQSLRRSARAGAGLADRSEKPRRCGPCQSGRRDIRRRLGNRDGHYRCGHGGRAERRGADLHRDRSGGRHREAQPRFQLDRHRRRHVRRQSAGSRTTASRASASPNIWSHGNRSTTAAASRRWRS